MWVLSSGAWVAYMGPPRRGPREPTGRARPLHSHARRGEERYTKKRAGRSEPVVEDAGLRQALAKPRQAHADGDLAQADRRADLGHAVAVQAHLHQALLGGVEVVPEVADQVAGLGGAGRV